jgi:hypothetical protein
VTRSYFKLEGGHDRGKILVWFLFFQYFPIDVFKLFPVRGRGRANMTAYLPLQAKTSPNAQTSTTGCVAAVGKLIRWILFFGGGDQRYSSVVRKCSSIRALKALSPNTSQETSITYPNFRVFRSLLLLIFYSVSFSPLALSVLVWTSGREHRSVHISEDFDRNKG